MGLQEKKVYSRDNNPPAARIVSGERCLAATPLMWERLVGPVRHGGWQRPPYQTGPTVIFIPHFVDRNSGSRAP